MVEDINHKIKETNRINHKEINEFYEQMELDDKERLKPVEIVINKIFKKYCDIKYNKDTYHRTYLTITLNRKLSTYEKSIMPIKIKQDLYHTEIIESEDKTIINIFTENVNLSIDKELK